MFDNFKDFNANLDDIIRLVCDLEISDLAARQAIVTRLNTAKQSSRILQAISKESGKRLRNIQRMSRNHEEYYILTNIMDLTLEYMGLSLSDYYEMGSAVSLTSLKIMCYISKNYIEVPTDKITSFFCLSPKDLFSYVMDMTLLDDKIEFVLAADKKMHRLEQVCTWVQNKLCKESSVPDME